MVQDNPCSTANPGAPQTMNDQKHEFNTSNFLESFVSCLQTILLTPAKFFIDMPLYAGYRSPFLFLLICLLLDGFLSIIFGGKALYMISYPLFGVISAIIMVVLVNFVLKKIFDIDGSYEGTFRIISYSSCVLIFASTPLLWFFAALYGLYISIIGIREVYALTTGKAFVTVLLVFLFMNLLRFIIPWIVALSPFGFFTG
jgi:hypothetical protein